MRLGIGLGFDIHRLVKKRRLILGGVRINYPKGLSGHSDGDVLLHALCDALLGALGWGDIGDYFPDTNRKYKNMDSTYFLEAILAKLRKAKYKLQNIDTIIFAEQPKLGKRKIKIKHNLAKLLSVPSNRVNIKAKTMEGLGPIGAQKAIAAMVLAKIQTTK